MNRSAGAWPLRASSADLFIGKALGYLGVFEDSRDNTAGSAGGSGDHGSVVGILLGYGVGLGGNPLKLLQAGVIVHRNLLI